MGMSYAHVEDANVRMFLDQTVNANIVTAGRAIAAVRMKLDQYLDPNVLSYNQYVGRRASFYAAETALMDFSNPIQCRALLQEFFDP